MRNAPFLLLTCLCLFSLGAGCARDGNNYEPDNGESETKTRNNEETKQESSSEDAEAVARKFVAAMNRFFEADFDPMLQLGKEGTISEPFWAILEKAIQNGGKGKTPDTAVLSFNRNVPEKDRVVFEVLLREWFPEGDFETRTMLLELKRTGSRWTVSNNGMFSELHPYDNKWEVKSPGKTVEEFFEAYKWIPREQGKNEEGDAVFYCASRATDEWLMNSGWTIGERKPDDPDESLAPNKEWNRKVNWRFSPAVSPKETDIVWKRIRIDDVDLHGNGNVSPEFSRQSLANLPYEEEHALLDELMKGAVVTVSFLDERDETMFQRKFLLQPLNPESPVWVIVGEMGESEPSNVDQAQNEKRDEDQQSQVLCSQTDDAWTTLQFQNKRFPDPDFIRDMVGSDSSGKFENGDIWFRMTPAACCLLNFWHPRSVLPATDRKYYSAKCGPGEYPTRESVESFGPYMVFECETWQKCFGLHAPWVRKKIVSIMEDNGVRDPDAVHDAIVEAVSKDAGWADGVHFGYGIVTVALDTNGDGKLVIPGSLIGEFEDVELRSTAAAWVWNEKRTKTSRSW